MTRLFRVVVLFVLVLILAVPAQAQQSQAEAQGPATVTFVHGIRGFFTDVYLDDKLILSGFAPERVTEPMKLSAGRHRIDLREADAPADAKPAVTKQFSVPETGQLTAIAHWVGIDECTITLFDDTGDVVAVGAGRLIARHAAATQDVRLAVDDQPLNTPLRPTEELSDTVDAGSHTVSVSDRKSKSTLVPGAKVPIPEGEVRVVYLVGTAKDDTLDLLTQTVDGLESQPSGVPTGNSGLAAGESQPWGVATLLLGALAAGLLTVAGRRVRGVRA